MADLNALIAQGYQFQAPPDPFVQYGKRQQLELGEQTNQLNQMKMQEAQAAAVKRNALSGLDPSSPDYENQLFKLDPTMGMAYRKDASIVAAQKATQEKQNTDAAAARQGILGQAFRDISSRPSDANITAHLEDVQASSLFKPEEKTAVQKLSQTLLSMPFGERGSFLASQGAKSSDLIAKPEPGFTLSPGQTRYPAGYSGVVTSPAAMPVVAAEPTTNEIKNAKAIALGAGPEGSPEYNQSLQTQLLRLTDKPVATAAAATSTEMKNADAFALLKGPAGSPAYNQEYAKQLARLTAKSEGGGGGAAKAPAGYRVTATGDLEAIPGGPAANKPMTEAQTIKLRIDVGKDYKNASTALSQIDDLLASAISVKTAPGLSAATGFTGMLPSFSEGAAAQAETRLANLRGKVTALGKATAAMGGAIGSIANQEWKILADQIAVLNEVKGKGPLLEQISLLEEQAKGASARIRDAYEKTRAEDFERFPQFRDLPAPKAPSGARVVAPNIDALLDKYLNKQK
jgi:hypothetical protein